MKILQCNTEGHVVFVHGKDGKNADVIGEVKAGDAIMVMERKEFEAMKKREYKVRDLGFV